MLLNSFFAFRIDLQLKWIFFHRNQKKCEQKKKRKQFMYPFTRNWWFIFLGATKHLYNWLCPSVGRSVFNAFVRRSTRRTLLAFLALFNLDVQYSIFSLFLHDIVLISQKQSYRLWRSGKHHFSEAGWQSRKIMQYGFKKMAKMKFRFRKAFLQLSQIMFLLDDLKILCYFHKSTIFIIGFL